MIIGYYNPRSENTSKLLGIFHIIYQKMCHSFKISFIVYYAEMQQIDVESG